MATTSYIPLMYHTGNLIYHKVLHCVPNVPPCEPYDHTLCTYLRHPPSPIEDTLNLMTTLQTSPLYKRYNKNLSFVDLRLFLFLQTNKNIRSTKLVWFYLLKKIKNINNNIFLKL